MEQAWRPNPGQFHHPTKVSGVQKTGIIAMAKMPEYLWLVTGRLNEFKPSKLEILKDRIVVVFPDLGAYNIWQKKASEMSFHVSVSDFLEQNATDELRKNGLDIADFL